MAMLLMFLVPPSSVSICSVPMLMSFIFRLEMNWLRTTSATSTALLMALPLAMSVTWDLLFFSAVMTAKQ